ncbi:MAG: hypothetical protein EA425_03670 [Puniceicoccaceae bacterium]|nr:MAG: hypothetical protein EA425_03670 [Puniceicoccaceae bacterium]
MPDNLARKVKRVAAERKTTMRALILDAIERSLEEPRRDFRLRDASAGDPADPKVAAETVNQAIDALREPLFRR